MEKFLRGGNTNYGELGNGVKVDTKTSPIDITSNFSFDEGDFPVNVISSVGQYVLTNNKKLYGFGLNRISPFTGGWSSLPYDLRNTLNLNENETVYFRGNIRYKKKNSSR
jgi:hypothetical protein